MLRNLKYNPDGSINCEIEHPQFGWIPFLATSWDPEPHGVVLYNNAVAGNYGPIEPADEETD